jgi:poly-gamma-glutamate capsule biosynthesis protein CapA/YwtB (metallophosphatase superfamily)
MSRHFLFAGWVGGIAAVWLLSLSSCGNGTQARSAEADFSLREPSVPTPPKDVEITIAAVGDLMCAGHQFQLAQTGPNEYDFFPSYQAVRPLLDGADLTLGNLETNLAGEEQGYRGFPRFNTPDAYAAPLREAGFDVLFTSNNHAMDNGEAGVRRTIRILDELGLGHTGSFADTSDRDSVRIVNVKGIKIGLLSYTSTTNGLGVPRGKGYLVNYIHFPRMKRDIARARALGAEVVLTYFHFGTEYSHDPNWWQETVVAEAIGNGADIILGSHPHVVQPVRFFKTQNACLDSGIVCFSLGNFLANEYRKGGDAGVIMNLRLKRDGATQAISLSGVDYVPTWTYRGTDPAMRRHVVLPAEWGFGGGAELAYLTAASKAQMRSAFEETRAVITRHTQALTIRGMRSDPGGVLEGQAATAGQTRALNSK